VTQPQPPGAYRLRPARPEDEPFLSAMLAFAANWRGREPTQPANSGVAHYVRGFGRPGDVGVIAESEGGPAGAAWCQLLRGAERGYGYVADHVPELAVAVRTIAATASARPWSRRSRAPPGRPASARSA
jgi:hypothetical protein